MLAHQTEGPDQARRPAPDALPPPPTRVFGAFVLEERVAGGRGWDVFRALSGPRPVWLKRLRCRFHPDEEVADRLLQIARGACGLRHPNVVRVLELGRVEGFVYSASERVDGADLATLQRAQGDRRLDPAVAALIARDCAAGLDAAHFLADRGRPLGLVHRAVHAGNVLIAAEGSVMVSDLVSFWSRMRLEEGSIELSVDEARGFSPEQARGEPLDYRSDVFSLGLLLYEMLAGEPAWPGDSVYDVLTAARTGVIGGLTPLCEQVPAELSEVLERSLAGARADRYARTADMAHDLSAFLCTVEPERARASLASLVTLASLVGTGSTAAPADPQPAVPRGETRVGPLPLLTVPRGETRVGPLPVLGEAPGIGAGSDE